MLTGELKVAQLRVVRESIETEQGLNGETLINGATNQDDLDNVDIAQFSAAREDYAVEGLQALDSGASLVGTIGFKSTQDARCKEFLRSNPAEKMANSFCPRLTRRPPIGRTAERR